MPNANPADLGNVDLPPLELPLPDRDMRSKRPPVLSFLLRWSTLRRAARVVSLLALDLAAIILAIFTALCLKAVVRDAWDPSVSWEQSKEYVPFAFLVASLLKTAVPRLSCVCREGLSRSASQASAILA